MPGMQVPGCNRKDRSLKSGFPHEFLKIPPGCFLSLHTEFSPTGDGTLDYAFIYSGVSRNDPSQ